jgi:hypothetical protein
LIKETDMTSSDERTPRSEVGTIAVLAALTILAAGCASARSGHGSSSPAHAGASNPATASAAMTLASTMGNTLSGPDALCAAELSSPLAEPQASDDAGDATAAVG